MPKPTKSLPSACTTDRSPQALSILLILLTLGVFGALGGCRARTSAPEPAEIISGTLFQLQNGRFMPIPEAGQLSATVFLPWTVQARVSDIGALGDRLYLGANSHGIAEMVPSPEGEPEFSYHYDSLIFRYRTLTTLIPEQDSLLCHLYFNKLLNVVGETELKLQGISLLRLIPSTGIYQFLTPPYQEKHPDWEAVGFVPVTPREFFLQWKYSDRSRTLFSYSRFDLAELEEEEVVELSYRKSYGFRDVREGSPAALKALLAAARSSLDEPGISTAYQLHVRTADQSLIQRYEYHPADFTSAEEIRLFTLSVFRREERFVLLLPDGVLLNLTSGSRHIQRFRLPSLPQDYVYGDLFLHGPFLVACWEQTAFTEVGAAGIFFAGFPLIP